MNHVKYEENSWCGIPLDHTFHFKDINQAIINNFHGERLVCRACLRSIVAALLTVPDSVLLTEEALNSTLESYGGTDD